MGGNLTQSGVQSGPETLRLGMIGGGSGAFIGRVHRLAAALDGRWRLVAGALSSTPERARASGLELGLAPERSYGTWSEMLKGELARPAEDRIDAVTIVTPNDTHYAPAKAFIAAGIAVICDKPLVPTVEQAESLVEAQQRSGAVFAVTYNYTGYPMVRRAREIVRSGGIGQVRKVFVEYHQGWLAEPIERSGQKQAGWRTDPARSGGGGSIGDIGTHAADLLTFITGLEIRAVCAELTSFVPGRQVDDDASVLLRLGDSKGDSGARGVLTASQVCRGESNGLSIRVYGELGSIRWRQEEPNVLSVTDRTGATTIVQRGEQQDGPGSASFGDVRLPPGHPEGFIEAFANLYSGAADAVVARRAGMGVPATAQLVPGLAEGLAGVRFVRAVLASGDGNGAWVTV